MEVSKYSIEFTKNFIKIKNCKTFYEAQAANHLKEIIQPPPNPPAPDKILLLLWNKNFLTEINRNILTFAFKVLQECRSWSSRNGGVHFFSDTKQKLVFWKTFKVRKAFGFLWEHIIFNVKWVKFCKMSEIFWAKLYCKMSDLFG